MGADGPGGPRVLTPGFSGVPASVGGADAAETLPRFLRTAKCVWGQAELIHPQASVWTELSMHRLAARVAWTP